MRMENLTDNFEEQNKPINSFLVDKLEQITNYIGKPNSEGNFFVQTNDFCLSSSEALKFISLADVFGYGITITKTDKLTIYFWKR